MNSTIRAEVLALYFDLTFPEATRRTLIEEELYNDTYGSLLSLTDSDQVWALRQIELTGRKFPLGSPFESSKLTHLFLSYQCL